MALEDFFKLSKLTIEGYSAAGRTAAEKATPYTYEVMFNPASFTMSYFNEFSEQHGTGQSASNVEFAHGSRKLSMKLIIDGTGTTAFGGTLGTALGLSKKVHQRIQEFVAIAFDVNNDIREPNFLILRWGAGPLEEFRCRLTSLEANFTSFTRGGEPLRAELTCSFVEDVDPVDAALDVIVATALVSTTRLVQAGDTLAQLCIDVYGSAQFLVRVAEANDLDNLTDLVPGAELRFPPLPPLGGVPS